MAFIVYQLGLVAEGRSVTVWSILAAALLLFGIYLLVRPAKKNYSIDGKVRPASAN